MPLRLVLGTTVSGAARGMGLTLLACAFLLGPATAHAQGYTFRVIADTAVGSAFDQLGVPVINSSGEVAFAASRRPVGGGIYKAVDEPGNTIAVKAIYEDSAGRSLADPFFVPALSDNGRVIFQLDTVVLSGSGTPLVPPVAIAPNGVPVDFGDRGDADCTAATLAGRGATSGGRALVLCMVEVVVDGLLQAGLGAYLGAGGRLDRLCDNGPTSTEDPFDFTPLFDVCIEQRAEVGPDGTVAAVGFRLNPFTAEPLLLRGTSILLDPAAHAGVTAFPNSTNQVAVNASGTVAYSAVQLSGVVGHGVYRIAVAGQPVIVADPNDGVNQDAVFPSINASGRVAFVNQVRRGLFAGPNKAFIHEITPDPVQGNNRVVVTCPDTIAPCTMQ